MAITLRIIKGLQIRFKYIKPIILAMIAARRPRTPKQVVFVSDQPRTRELKIAYGLYNMGWQVILIHRDKPTFYNLRYFAEIRNYRKPWEALSLCAHYTPVVYHVFSLWSFNVASMLIRYKVGKIVFDDYDVIAGMVREDVKMKFTNKIDIERYCLEHADGLCCRSLETQFAKRYLGYKFKGPRIFFPEYTWFKHISKNTNVNLPKKSIVYCGSFWYSSNQPIYFTQIAKRLATIGWDLYIYSLENLDKILHDRPSNLYINSKQDPQTLIKKISQYSAGLQIPDRIAKLQNCRPYNDNKRLYSMSCKIFDYLDGGMPIIISDQKFQAWFLGRYKVSIKLDNKNPLDTLIQLNFKDVKKLRNIVKSLKNKITMAGNIDRLIKFYLSVSSN